MIARAADDATVVPPAVDGPAEVPYPAEATGDATVVLEVLVRVDGSVADVSIVEGKQPFSEHARAAVLDWRFVPAQRAGEAVAARVRVHIDFREPPRETAEPAAAAVTATAAAPPASAKAPAPQAPAPQAPVEITVSGMRAEIGQTTLAAEEVRQLPGAFGDAFRAVEALPGVTPMLSGVPFFYVRGAPPNNNGYFVDGIRVPLLFHVGLGPSVIHPGLLDRVEFYPSVAPVRYGGVAGGIIAGETRAPAPVARGEANLRLVDAGALLESPFAAGRGNALVAGRYGYPGPILSAFSDVRLGYWDYQTRLSARVGAHDTLGLFAFGSHDYLAHEEEDGTLLEDFVSDFHRVDLRYDRAWDGGRLRVAATLGLEEQGANPTFLTNKSVAGRVELEQDLAETLRLRGGLEGRLDHYGIEHRGPADAEGPIPPSNAEPPRQNLTPAAHADLVWRLLPSVELVPGVRVTLFDSSYAPADPGDGDPEQVRTTVLAVDPRLSARVTLLPRLAWLSSFGLAHQYPALRVGELPAPIAAGAGFPEGTSELQRVLQQSQGLEAVLPWELVLGVTGFLTYSWGLTDLTQSCLQIEPPTATPGEGPPELPWHCPSNEPVSGHAYGVEVLLRRSFSERVSGLISYTLSRSVREAHFLTLDGGQVTATVPSEFDRTHVLNAILSVDLGRHWRAGSRFVLYSGVPYSALSGSVPVPPYHAYRDPTFYRVDVRLEKRWLFERGRSVAFVVEGQNVTLRKEANTLGMDCRGTISRGPPETYTTECERGTVGPITLPSIGVEGNF
ncbi:MAG TPA: TonB family protein [Polyangiaceae bacterium]